jgi:LuxR family transcriptional regulator of csgAB operon
MKFTNLYIWGPNPFNNQLLASHIESFLGKAPQCFCITDKLDSNAFDCGSIIFCDCDKTDPCNYCRALHRPGYDLEKAPGIALINVQPEQDLLDEIKTYAIYGVFYTIDTFDLIDKGIKKMLDGEHWLSRDLLVRSLQSARKESRKEKGGGGMSILTLREHEILELIVAGHDNQAIADRLFISPNTVKTHVSNIYKKIDATNRVQAIIWAAENAGRSPFVLY